MLNLSEDLENLRIFKIYRLHFFHRLCVNSSVPDWHSIAKVRGGKPNDGDKQRIVGAVQKKTPRS